MKSKRMLKMLQFILPTIIGQICFFLFTIIDGIFVGNGIGEDALGAVNIVFPFIMVINAIYMLIIIGGVAVTAVRFGRGDKVGGNDAFMHAFAIMLGIGIVLTIGGIICAKPLAYFFGANDTYMPYVVDYLICYSIFIVPSALSMLLQFFCRTDGSPMLVMIATIAASACNIFLDWLFVFPLHMGMRGAAIATGISQTVSFLIMLCHFIFKKGSLRFQTFSFQKRLLGKIFLRGFPETIAQFAVPIFTICMNHVLLSYIGEIAVNAYSVIGYVASFSVAIFIGVSSGAQPLFGEAYGEKADGDLKFYFRVSVIIDMMGSVLVYILLLFVGKPICNLFDTGKETSDFIIMVLPKYAWGFVPMALNTIISSYLYSTKRTIASVIANICRSFLFTIPIVFILPILFGESIIWFAFGICECLSLVVSLLCLVFSERKGIIYR